MGLKHVELRVTKYGTFPVKDAARIENVLAYVPTNSLHDPNVTKSRNVFAVELKPFPKEKVPE